MDNFKNCYKLKSNLIITIITAPIIFISSNLTVLVFWIIGSNNFKNSNSSLFTSYIVILAVIIVLAILFLSKLEKLIVIANNIRSTAILVILSIVSIVFSFGYLVFIYNNIYGLAQDIKNILTILSIGVTILLSYFSSLKNIPLLKVKIDNQNGNFKDEILNIKKDDNFKVRVLCDSNNEDTVVFAGFCLSEDFDKFSENIQDAQKYLMLPKKIEDAEVVKPHHLSNEYVFSTKEIIDVLKEHKVNIENNVIVSVVFKNSDNNYFCNSVKLNLNNESKTKVIKKNNNDNNSKSFLNLNKVRSQGNLLRSTLIVAGIYYVIVYFYQYFTDDILHFTIDNFPTIYCSGLWLGFAGVFAWSFLSNQRKNNWFIDLLRLVTLIWGIPELWNVVFEDNTYWTVYSNFLLAVDIYLLLRLFVVTYQKCKRKIQKLNIIKKLKK